MGVPRCRPAGESAPREAGAAECCSGERLRLHGAIKGAAINPPWNWATSPACWPKLPPRGGAGAGYDGARSAKNSGFVDAVARKHVELTMADMRGRSPALADLEAKGMLKIAGAMYDVETAQVAFSPDAQLRHAHITCAHAQRMDWWSVSVAHRQPPHRGEGVQVEPPVWGGCPPSTATLH